MSDFRVVGLDVSTYVGMAFARDGDVLGKVVHFPTLKGWSRLQSIARDVERTLTNWAPNLVLIEGYAYGNRNSLVILVECGTIVRNVVHSLGLRWMEIPPTVLKKWTTGNGSASKQSMAESVHDRWGYRSPSDDIVDAYALARMGQMGLEKLAAIKGVKHGS